VLGRIDVNDELGSERPCGVAVGSNAVWIVTVSGKIAEIDVRTSEPIDLIDTGGATCVAAGAGAVWVTNADENKVVRIDPETGDLTDIPVGGFPEGIAFGFRSVWVAASDPPDGGNGAISRIDPRTNEVVRTILVANLPEFVAAGSGMVWATSNNGTIVEIDPRTNQTVSTVRITDGGRTSVTAGGGYAWASEIQTTGEASRVYRVAPSSGEVTQLPASLPAVNPLGMAWGANALWIADYNAGSVVKYQPAPATG
jgi:streptogramin lyase